jgi:hypothetical protein
MEHEKSFHQPDIFAFQCPFCSFAGEVVPDFFAKSRGRKLVQNKLGSSDLIEVFNSVIQNILQFDFCGVSFVSIGIVSQKFAICHRGIDGFCFFPIWCR